MGRKKITFDVPITLTMTVVDNDSSPMTVQNLLAHRINAAASDIAQSLHVEDLEYEIANAEAVSVEDAEEIPQ